MKRLTIYLVATLIAASCSSSGERSDLRQKASGSFAYHYNLGLAEFEQGRYRNAIKHYLQSLKLNNKVARTQNEIGICYLYLGENGNAINHFEQALSLDSGLDETRNSLGIAYFGIGRYRDAELQFHAVLSSPEYGTRFIPLFNLGNLYVKEERYELAMQSYLQALQDEARISPDYRINIKHQMGLVYSQLKQYKEALDEFRKVLVLNPRHVEATFNAGLSAYYLGDEGNARNLFARVITIGSNAALSASAQEYLDKLNK